MSADTVAAVAIGAATISAVGLCVVAVFVVRGVTQATKLALQDTKSSERAEIIKALAVLASALVAALRPMRRSTGRR